MSKHKADSFDYHEPSSGAADRYAGKDVPLSGQNPAGYDDVQNMDGEAWDVHEVGPNWDPVGDDF
jgi:hypothetical protein